MTEHQKNVKEFHQAFGLPVKAKPTMLFPNAIARRLALIREEVDELEEALRLGTLTEIAKELADVEYVIHGTAIECGIDTEPCFKEVHRSNMSKVDGYLRADGKWMKPLTYSPANLDSILQEQGA